MENNKLNWKKLIDDLDIKYDERFLLGENLETLLRRDIFTLGARGFSCAVSGFGQVLKSDPGPERRLYQNIQNLDVLLILGDIECFKCSDWITITTGAWSGRGWFEDDKDQIQTIQAHITYV